MQIYACGMLTIVALILALTVLPSPWGWVAVIVAALIDVLETLVFLWWSKRRKAAVGVETLVGRQAVVVRTVAPRGQVKLDGEVWDARAAQEIELGAEVVVTGLDGLVLDVETALVTDRCKRRDDIPPDARVRRHRVPGLGASAGPADGRGRAARGARRACCHAGTVSPSLGGPTRACTPPGRWRALPPKGGPPVERLAAALSSELPDDVAVLEAAPAPDGFHARFSATGRSYRYVVLNRPVRAPLRASRALWWPRPARPLGAPGISGGRVGRHDFTAFTPTETHHGSFCRDVREASWERRGDELHFTHHGRVVLAAHGADAGRDDARAGRRGAPDAAEGPPAKRSRHDRAAVGALPRAGRVSDGRTTGDRLTAGTPGRPWLRSTACATASFSSTSTGR